MSGLKAGLLTFGGAYTAIPFMRDDVVRRGWTGDAQFLDAVALAQVIPAPLIIFATFIGYAAGGLAGAVAITLGVFLPAFAFSMVFHDRLEQLVSLRWLHALLDGVAAGVVGLIAATTLQLAVNAERATANPPMFGAILGIALLAIVLWRHRLAAPAILIVAGATGLLVLGPAA
jgi:chromate transporter